MHWKPGQGKTPAADGRQQPGRKDVGTPLADAHIVPHSIEESSERTDNTMTEREKRELLNALGWFCGALLVGVIFLAPFWVPVSWIVF